MRHVEQDVPVGRSRDRNRAGAGTGLVEGVVELGVGGLAALESVVAVVSCCCETALWVLVVLVSISSSNFIELMLWSPPPSTA